MSEKYLIGFLVVIAVLLAALQPGFGFWAREGIQGGTAVPADELRSENAALKAQLARHEIAQYQLPDFLGKTTLVEVHSRYPFGLKNELLVNAGEKDGVRVGQPALFHGMFVGVVMKVFDHAAIIETIFDVRAKYAVRVGKKSFDALLEGGSEPRLTLIANSAEIESGATIYSAAPSVPYGLAVGTVKEGRAGRSGLFQESTIAIPYSIGEIRVLEIMTEHVPPSL
ncbi:MAG: hypothetical protein HYY10_04245 [Candidatus Liptonbacteria bacterium]|nr:hypothetical protein [Candidatus Liptonbacteria bacterium]